MCHILNAIDTRITKHPAHQRPAAFPNRMQPHMCAHFPRKPHTANLIEAMVPLISDTPHLHNHVLSILDVMQLHSHFPHKPCQTAWSSGAPTCHRTIAAKQQQTLLIRCCRPARPICACKAGSFESRSPRNTASQKPLPLLVGFTQVLRSSHHR